MFNQDYNNGFEACSARALAENRSAIRMKKEQERRECIEDAAEISRRSTTPVVEELKALVIGLQEQNRILQSQIDEAKKDSEKAKEMARMANEDAKKESKKARIFSWVSFGVATAISVVALVVSIIALF